VAAPVPNPVPVPVNVAAPVPNPVPVPAAYPVPFPAYPQPVPWSPWSNYTYPSVGTPYGLGYGY